MGFIKSIFSSKALVGSTIESLEKLYWKHREIFPNKDQHYHLAMTLLSRFRTNGHDVRDESTQDAAFSGSFVHACVPHPFCAKALGLFVVYKEMPQYLQKHPKFIDEYNALMLPVYKAMDDEIIDELYAKYNPNMAREAFSYEGPDLDNLYNQLSEEKGKKKKVDEKDNEKPIIKENKVNTPAQEHHHKDEKFKTAYHKNSESSEEPQGSYAIWLPIIILFLMIASFFIYTSDTNNTKPESRINRSVKNADTYSSKHNTINEQLVKPPSPLWSEPVALISYQYNFVRYGPDPKYGVVGALNKGQKVYVHYNNGFWNYISWTKDSDGSRHYGWIKANTNQTENNDTKGEPRQSDANIIEPKSIVDGFEINKQINEDFVEIMYGPGNSFSILDILEKGKLITVKQANDDWYYISWLDNDGTEWHKGWMHKSKKTIVADN